ncbi:methyl-accepting chemotaxis protein [Rhizomicrobium palustre]|uniref:Methyl-accepting chemotaxis protein n=1 Tax=Rhizomicrobium palustre TaxID=189966 RepID=A0A846N0R1_9PROT|nr:methyl-accepting chemotaxis protein [Rhizomicrobium palustre]NIK89286.1 methyl-accepting chemotaxis protein [Rhizomicrobium palustre]
MSNFCGNLSVRLKLALVMGVVLIAAIALGIFSLMELRSVNANAAEIRNDWLPSTRILGDLNYAVTRTRSSQSTALLLPAGAKQEKQIARIKGLEESVDKALADYRPYISSGEEKTITQSIETAWANYRVMYDKALELSRGGDRDAAAAYFMGPMRDSFDALNKAITQDVALNAAGGVAAADRSAKTFDTAEFWIFVAIAACALICVSSTLLLTACIAKPLFGITDALAELASGHLGVEVPYSDREDEIGKLAGGMLAFKNQLAAAEQAKAEQADIIVSSIGAGLSHLAKGDLTHRITAELAGPFGPLKDDFNEAVGKLQSTVTTILSNTADITSGATEISQAADDLSRRTEQQAASLEETAAALEEITETLKRTAANTKEADKESGSAAHVAKEGGEVLQSANLAMDAIAQSSKEITDIIGVIDEIAFQTNLLALNAGVEAARAGEAGKGFAVVASEVRALAGRSGEAAKKIKTLIHSSGDQVSSGVKLVGESATALQRIVEQVQRINKLVSDVANAAGQQSSAIQEVNSAVGQMDQVTQQNAAMVEQSTAAARSLADKTRALQELVSFFEIGSVVRRDPPRPSASAAQRSQLAPRRTAAAVSSRPAVAAVNTDAGWAEF